MRFWVLFFHVVFRHPLRAGAALFWLCLGKKIRARNRLGLLITNVQKRYKVWQQLNEDFSDEARAQALQDIEGFGFQPRFLLLVSPGEGRLDFSDQWYSNYKAQRSGSRISGEFDYILNLRAGDKLAPHALFSIARAVQDIAYDFITFDDDQIDKDGHRSFAHFKPRWNPLLQIAANYVGLSCAIKMAHGTDVPAFLAKLCLHPSTHQHYHLPLILRHAKAQRHVNEHRLKNTLKDWRKRLDKEAGGNLAFEADHHGWLRPLYPVPEEKVSLIIPTRDMLNVLKPCVDSILQKTNYSNYEILIVDNGSEKAETLAYFDSLAKDKRVRILAYPGVFNYSAINNFAVTHALGDYIGLINNDTEVIDPDWLGECMRYAVRPEIGAVGAKLLYGDNRIQHAGVVVGLGHLAGHGHRMLGETEPGYFYRAHQVQYVSAVTAAALIVQREKYLQVGGLDAENLVVAFNDVDFCLKLDRAGLHNVYTPYARLYHHESKSRGKDNKGEKLERYLREADLMHARWRTHKKVDKYYNVNLTESREDFSIKISQLPWRKIVG